MISPSEFYETLLDKGIEFYTGVPDSLLKDFNSHILENVSKERHIIAANEGNSIGLAAGWHLATGKMGLIYMQNSGQGNSVNPLISLADPTVYSIPMILLIGWRGEPGTKDEPQHIKQGKITISLLDTLGIPYEILSDNISDAKNQVEKAISKSKEISAPFAIVVKNGTFEEYKIQEKNNTSFELDRETALKLVVDTLDAKDVVVSTTGKISRELFEYRKKLNQDNGMDFLTVGSMGHSSSIALGIALAKPNRQVYCFDGDGALIMHLGALGIIGIKSPENFKHIVFNNGSHDSVGGQPTVGFQIDILKIAKASGFKEVWRAESREGIKEKISLLKQTSGPALLEIRVNKGARKDLGRPIKTPIENKKEFMRNLSEY
jgi:phosphonopyruvate decarboxylase